MDDNYVDFSDFKEVVGECHRVLDAAGVPSADGQICNEIGCNSKLGHRVRWLVNKAGDIPELDRLGAIDWAMKAGSLPNHGEFAEPRQFALDMAMRLLKLKKGDEIG